MHGPSNCNLFRRGLVQHDAHYKWDGIPPMSHASFILLIPGIFEFIAYWSRPYATEGAVHSNIAIVRKLRRTRPSVTVNDEQGEILHRITV